MKVVIFTEGGINIGLGHISRCSSLYDEIATRGFDVEVVINGEAIEINFLKDKKVLFEDWQNYDFLQNKINKETFVIVDSYLAQKEIYDFIALISYKSLFIDDYNRIEYPKGILINPNVSIDGLKYSEQNSKTLFYGKDFIILRSSFLMKNDHIINKTCNKILIMLGGTDPKNVTPKILQNLCINYPEILFKVILSKNKIEEIEKVKYSNNIEFYSNLDENEMYNIMCEVDFAITACGQTIFELMATQTPFLAVQIADNQDNNRKILEKNIGYNIVLDFEDKDFELKLNEFFKNAILWENRKNISKVLGNIISFDGRKNIIDLLIKDFYKKDLVLRKANKEDVESVFKLSNEDYVRRYSINKDKILWENHIKWFENVIFSEKDFFYIVTNNEKDFLGQVRFNISENECVISISLSIAIKGKGLANDILKKSLYAFFEEEKKTYDIIAYIDKENIGSIKLFKSVGFKEIFPNNNLLRFILKKGDFYENR
ncbi:MAG: GNAT family N-acetyltransferase [Lachnospirales bacterium]